MKSYELTTRAGVKYTAQFTDEDAERYGLLQNKKVTPDNKKLTYENDELQNKEEKPASSTTPVKRPGAAPRTRKK